MDQRSANSFSHCCFFHFFFVIKKYLKLNTKYSNRINTYVNCFLALLVDCVTEYNAPERNSSIFLCLFTSYGQRYNGASPSRCRTDNDNNTTNYKSQADWISRLSKLRPLPRASPPPHWLSTIERYQLRNAIHGLIAFVPKRFYQLKPNSFKSLSNWVNSIEFFFKFDYIIIIVIIN